MDDFFFCPSCYEEAGKNTHFAPTFKFQGTSCPEASYDMYTDNMRSRYFRACSQQSLEDFLLYCQERAKVFQMLKRQIEFSKSLQQIKSKNASFQTFMAGMGRANIQMNHGMTAAVHGHHYVPQFDMSYQEANRAYHKAQRDFGNSLVTGMDPTTRLLLEKWKAVE
jgi:hypothetical protein